MTHGFKQHEGQAFGSRAQYKKISIGIECIHIPDIARQANPGLQAQRRKLPLEVVTGLTLTRYGDHQLRATFIQYSGRLDQAVKGLFRTQAADREYAQQTVRARVLRLRTDTVGRQLDTVGNKGQATGSDIP